MWRPSNAPELPVATTLRVKKTGDAKKKKKKRKQPKPPEPVEGWADDAEEPEEHGTDMQSTLAQVHTEATDFVSRGGLDMVAEEDGAESESDESVTSDSSADSMTLADRIDDALVLSDIDAIRAVVDEAHREGSAHPGLIALEHKLASLEEQIAAAIEQERVPALEELYAEHQDGTADEAKYGDGAKDDEAQLGEEGESGGDTSAPASLVCPEVSSPGDVVSASTASGREETVTVPDGVSPGGEFEAELPASKGEEPKREFVTGENPTPTALAHEGEIEVQYRGRRKFYAIHLSLAKGGAITFTEPAKGKGKAKGFLRAAKGKAHSSSVLRTAQAAGCTVGVAESSRRGHEHSFRIDLAHPDSKGDSMYVFSATSAEEMTVWKRSFAAYSHMSSEEIEDVIKSSAVAAKDSQIRHPAGEPYRATICPSELCPRARELVIEAQNLAEMRAEVQRKLGLTYDIALHSYDADFDEFVELEEENFGNMWTDVRLEIHRPGSPIDLEVEALDAAEAVAEASQQDGLEEESSEDEQPEPPRQPEPEPEPVPEPEPEVLDEAESSEDEQGDAAPPPEPQTEEKEEDELTAADPATDAALKGGAAILAEAEGLLDDDDDQPDDTAAAGIALTDDFDDDPFADLDAVLAADPSVEPPAEPAPEAEGGGGGGADDPYAMLLGMLDD